MSEQKPQKFEESLAELEATVTKIESGELTLEDSLAAFERGVGLVKVLNERLGAVEQRIEVLTRDGNGTLWVVVDFVKGPALNTPPPVPQGSTIGNIDSVWRQPGSIGVFGWAIDPDTTSPIQVHIYVDGAFAGQTKADIGRPDISAETITPGAR